MSALPPDEAKRKRAQGAFYVPDRRLAVAFEFTASDLASNRAGYVSWAQMMGIPRLLRSLFAPLERVLPRMRKNRPQVRIACGRADLQHYQRENFGFFRVDITEFYIMEIENVNEKFTLTREQYQHLNTGIFYRVYYAHDSNWIFSIERADDQCKEA